MAFNNCLFILFFLLPVLIGYHIAARISNRAGLMVLLAASTVFYSRQGWQGTVFLSIAILVNYTAGLLIERLRDRQRIQGRVFLGAILMNIGMLAMLKWLPEPGNPYFGQGGFSFIAMPLGFSFFCFAQIGYLVDLKNGVTATVSLPEQALFGAWFPHVTSGPILRHKEFVSQLPGLRGLRSEDLALGLTYFAAGLFKKALADKMSVSADSFYAHTGGVPVGAAWVGVLSYGLQLFLDFSGYSDMAIGIARMFSVRYPFNFDAPYQALSIIDFWQRWHMSLTRFIMVYIYTPLSTHMARLEMNRGRGSYKKIIQTFSGFCKVVALPMMITMTLAGVWHGYGITFLVFGAVHGVFLTINNFWRTSWKQRVLAMAEWSEPVKVISKIGASVLVLGCVMVGQVFFRADSLAQAATVFRNLLAISRGSTPIEGNFKIVLLVGAILLIGS